jgi:dihydrofolate synthase / folylpolyglutamate synthase
MVKRSMARLPAHRIAGLYLAQRTRFGMKFGLATMQALVDEMGHPERAFPSLLIAGTNGKGSVAAYCDSVLRASGLRVGRYTSPHLVRVTERITVSGREISAPAFGRAVRAVRDAAARLVQRGTLDAHPTFFEVLTAAAFEHFRAQRIDVAVLEVGLGGRLDATNVVLPLASAIVSIAFDHEVYLGRTLAAIAGEKAGVMRPARPTVIGAVPVEAGRALRRHARATGARLLDAGAGPRPRTTPTGIELRTPERLYRGLRPLPGAHQLANLQVAIRLLEAARGQGLPVALDAVPEAIARTRWPGRLERIAGDPPLVLDGAHNPAGARALAAHLRGGPPFVLVFAAMADKDVAGLARALFPLATAVVLTQPRVSRAASPAELARRCGPLARGAEREASVWRALGRARRLAGRHTGTVVVVAGSLYLVGEVEAILERESARTRRSRLVARRAR